jgi:hypothetical protein
MKKYTIMFSEYGKGWTKALIPPAMQGMSYEDIINWAAEQARSRNLKGFLVSENPCPFPFGTERELTHCRVSELESW